VKKSFFPQPTKSIVDEKDGVVSKFNVVVLTRHPLTSDVSLPSLRMKYTYDVVPL
jgi:hypothetical protein